ncbi:MAG: hypothetical protein ACJARX_002354 [Psychroserpens sp.]|jgi:hypothetical protein
MVTILYDVLIINAVKRTSKTILELKGVHPEDYIFKKYRIDRTQFALSHAYYASNIEDYQSIMTNLEQKHVNNKEDIQFRLEK